MSEEIKVSLVQAGVTKISLQPGDVLGVKVSATDVSGNALENLQNMLTEMFPDNRVMVFCMKPTDNITFEKIETAAKDCSTNYCEDCNCGKKELALTQGESK